jgi:predicted lipid-binding transport protein (Tim44 family)
MDAFFDIPTLIVIGVAIVVLFRLRSVLGTRTGHERTPAERGKPDLVTERKPAAELPLPMRARAAGALDIDGDRRARKLQAEIEQFSHGDAEIAEGLRAVVEADPAFSPRNFLDGAKQAYEMIVTAFATGDRKTLKMLLDKDVYDGFEKVMTEREAAGSTVDFTFVGLPKIDISHASYDRRNVLVSVQFHADVVSATHDRSGQLIEGIADQVQHIADDWTFARNPKSRDPNWKLVATNQLD